MHLCNSREKACSNCGWKHQCKCYYAFPFLSHIGWWHVSVSADCQWQSRSAVYWLASVTWSHCLHPSKSRRELLCEISPAPFGEFTVWQLTPDIDWRSSDHIFTSNNPSRNLRLLCTSGLPFLLSLIHPAGYVGVAPSQALHLHLYLLSLSLSSLFYGIAWWTSCSSSNCLFSCCSFPESDKELSNAVQHLRLDNLCGKDVTRSGLERHWDIFLPTWK